MPDYIVLDFGASNPRQCVMDSSTPNAPSEEHRRSTRPSRVVLSKWIRRIHLFAGLFLAPWVLMYSLSSIGMIHREAFTGHSKRVPPEFVVERVEPYNKPFAEDATADQAATQILEDLDLAGGFKARGSPDSKLVITRDRAIGSHRVTYENAQVTVEKQKFGLNFFLEMLHRRSGYQEPYLTNDLWAIAVDVVIIAIIAWAFTGIWMWWEMVRTRFLGGLAFIAGTLLFILFLALI